MSGVIKRLKSKESKATLKGFFLLLASNAHNQRAWEVVNFPYKMAVKGFKIISNYKFFLIITSKIK